MKSILKKSAALLLSGAVALSAACISASAVSLPSEKISMSDLKLSDKIKGDYKEGEAIVVLKDNADSDYTKKQKASVVYGQGISLKNSISIKKGSGSLRMAVLKSSKLSTKEILSGLKRNSGIKYAFPNYKRKVADLTNDEYSKFQWALNNTGQNSGTEGEDIKINALWNKTEKSGDEKVIAVLDTGIDYKSDDFKDVLWENPYGNKLLGDYGYDLTGTYSNGKPLDDYGHGTHVAGIIASKSGDGVGISGMNKNNVKIMSVKIFDANGESDDECIFAGFEYVQRAIELGTKVCAINCSFGGEGDKYDKAAYDEIFNALGEKGVISCVAAGNESLNLNDAENPASEDYDFGLLTIPACCDSPYCVTVGATDENGDLDDFSNYGDKYVDVAAPGDNILSNVSYNCFNPTIYTDEQRAELCAYYQSYDEKLSESAFGYPITVTDIPVDVKLSNKVKYGQSDRYFGLSGKTLKVYVDGKKPEKTAYYAFEIPYTLDNEDDNYDISMALNSKSFAMGYVFDIPADNDNEDIDNDTYNSGFYAFGGNDWTHFILNVDTSEKNYEKSKDRKLVVLVSASDDLLIDDLAVSNQSVSSEKFGKYDFMSGTSMATPFVTGAVALAGNAYPEASVKEIINIVKSTGKVSEKLTGKIKNGKTLTLDNTDKIPPMIDKASYDSDGNIKLEGVFGEDVKVYVGSDEAEIVSRDKDSIVIKDNGYNTRIVKIKVENKNGADTLETLLSNKNEYPVTKKVDGYPSDTSSAIMVHAGKKAYFVDTLYASVGVLDTEEAKNSYTFTDDMYMMDLKSIFDSEYFIITSAVYMNNRIYFTARNSITSSDKYYTLGYETILGYYDLNRGKTVKVCDVPDECLEGSTLAALNGSLYLIGGFVYKDLGLIDSVYKYDASKNEFTKTAASLPEARAYTSFIEYKGKLVGFYGAVESGEMPPAVVFDGKSWKTSSLKLESSDCEITEFTNEDKTFKTYTGNLGWDKNGVFCNGSYVTGFGDTFTYDVDNDKLIESKYCYRNDLTEPRLVGTTVPGAFIGFNIVELYGDDDYDDYNYYAKSVSDSYEGYYKLPTSDSSDSEEKVNTYLIELDNTSLYPAIAKKPSISSAVASLKAGAVKTLSVKNGKVKSWSSSNKAVATVSGGKVTALKKGSSTITAALTTGEKVSCKVTVTTSPSIKVKGKALNSITPYKIKKGGKLTLNITGKAASVKNVYSSTKKKVAKVISKTSAKKVKIKAYKKGNATVTVKVNGVSFKIKVKVFK